MKKTITAADIMGGLLPTSCREFDIEGVGRIKLHRLPAVDEAKARENMSNTKERTEAELEALEKQAERNIYYMLHGKFDNKEAAKLTKVMDTHQLSLIYTTGLFFTNLDQTNLEANEKN